MYKMFLKLRRINCHYPRQCYSSLISTSCSIKEEKIKIGKYIINYVKVGRGPHNVICVPGSLGTIWTDFKYQIDSFDRNKFSLVVCDPAASGKSYMPEEENMGNILERDANVAYELMKALEIPHYSYMGWSSGGLSGIILAATHPEIVDKLVVWGMNTHIRDDELNNYIRLKDLRNWNERALKAMTKIYGKEVFVKKLNIWIENYEKNYKSYVFDNLLADIQCPTLILHGEKDHMVHISHVELLRKRLKHSRVHLYPEGRHNIHIKYADDFNRRVQDFLLQRNDK